MFSPIGPFLLALNSIRREREIVSNYDNRFDVFFAVYGN